MIDSRYQRRPRYGAIRLSELDLSKKSGQKRGPSSLEEILLWQIRVAGLPAPEREYAFCPDRRYRADFAFISPRLLVEVEGGVWSRGRHNRALGFIQDCEKGNQAVLLGFRVLRFTEKHIRDGSAVTMIEYMLAQTAVNEIQFCEPTSS
jgi:very-short-patch-repair endonuclease